MTEFFCTKYKMAKGAALVPSHQVDEEALAKLPVGQPLRVKVTRVRNVGHHRKYFALLNFAYDSWEPARVSGEMQRAASMGIMPGQVEKNFERFRKDIIILAGFYESHWRLNGRMQIEPKSISFSSMEQDEFEELYNKTFDVILKHVLKGYSREDLERVMREIEEFE